MRFTSGVITAAVLLLGARQASAQTRILTGRVTDSLTNEVVTSGQVSVQGTTIGATVKDDGTFTISAPARDIVLTVRSIGFKRRDINVPASQNSVQAKLERDYFQLEAIVVTGQATGIERKNLANAVATVTSEQLVKAPTASVEEALQGKMAGVQILANTGAPGGGDRMRLRGVTSIIGDATPLYVVDGVIISDVSIAPGINQVTRAASATQLANASQENPVNRVADLNPNDIENVELLKGASASAIYGSKASNGVIIITTKRGRAGAPQFNISQQFGTARLSNRIGLRYFRDSTSAKSAFGQTTTTGVAGVGCVVQGNNVCWTPNYTPQDFEDQLYNNKPLSFETSVGVNGGTETTRYFASGLVRHEGGIVTNTYAEKQALRLNLDQNVGSRFQFAANTEVVRSESDRGLTGNDNTGTAYGFVIHKTPSFFDMRAICPDGSRQALCKGGVYPSNPYSNSNALQTASLFKNTETVWRVLTGGRMQLDAIKTPQHTVRFLGTGGVDVFTQKNVVISPPELQFEPTDGFAGTYGLSFSQNLNMNMSGNVVHTFKPLSGAFTATTQFGVQYEIRDLNTSRAVARNLLGGVMALPAGTSQLTDEDHQRSQDFGLFAQEEFLTLNDRLLFTIGGRADQSSNNGDPNKLFYYPKSSVSYRFTKPVAAVDEFKLRLAVGASGNQPAYGAKFTNLSSGNIGTLGGFTISTTAGNPNLKPERQRELESGFDATLFGSRANIEFTVYEKRITDLILNRTLGPSTGFSSERVNGGVLRTRGLETSLNLVGIQTPATQWNTRFNFALSRSKILEIPVPPFLLSALQTGAFRIAPDTSPTLLFGNDTTQRASPTDGLTLLPTPGRALGEITPHFTLSLANDVTHRAVRVYWLWDWQDGGWLAAGAFRHNEISRNSPDYETLTAVNLVGANNTPLCTTSPCMIGDLRQALYRNQTRVYFQPAGFLKLREVQVTLDLPNSWVRKYWGGARYARVGLAGRNLLQITPYRGGDPEAGNFNFSSTLPGARELMSYPPSRSFWLKIDLGF